MNIFCQNSKAFSVDRIENCYNADVVSSTWIRYERLEYLLTESLYAETVFVEKSSALLKYGEDTLIRLAWN